MSEIDFLDQWNLNSLKLTGMHATDIVFLIGILFVIIMMSHAIYIFVVSNFLGGLIFIFKSIKIYD